jgi:hypothetical protein
MTQSRQCGLRWQAERDTALAFADKPAKAKFQRVSTLRSVKAALCLISNRSALLTAEIFGRGFSSAANMQLPEDASQVIPNRSSCDIRLLCNFFVGETFGEQPKNLSLACG